MSDRRRKRAAIKSKRRRAKSNFVAQSGKTGRADETTVFLFRFINKRGVLNRIRDLWSILASAATIPQLV
jgi:hypothetical protein